MASTDNSPSIDERVYLNRVHLFFGLAKGNMAGIFVGTVLVGLVLHSGGTAASVLGVWVGLIAASLLAVVLYEQRVQRTTITVTNCKTLLWTRIGLGACIALLWGLAGFLLPSADTEFQHTYIFITLTTLVTVGALGYSAMPAYYLIINAVSLVPLSAKFAWQLLVLGDEYYLLLLAGAVAWQVVVMKKALQVSGTVINAISVNEQLSDEMREHERTKALLQHMAQQDPLTGLANRALFSDRLNQTLALAQRNGTRCAQLYIDLDHFKPVNDQFGHATGDLLLKDVASRMLACVRESDTVARIGGDEFVVLLPHVEGSESALHVAQKIRAAMANPFTIDGHDIRIGCCVGVAVYPDNGRNETELSARADAAMYAAKHDGGNSVRLAEPA